MRVQLEYRPNSAAPESVQVWADGRLVPLPQGVQPVRDSGAGLAVEARDKLFEPFYTTKSEGMGMGLNICRSIIESHQGRLWVDDNETGGCTFRFTLPLTVEPAIARAA